jgi:hypothetical protein
LRWVSCLSMPHPSMIGPRRIRAQDGFVRADLAGLLRGFVRADPARRSARWLCSSHFCQPTHYSRCHIDRVGFVRHTSRARTTAIMAALASFARLPRDGNAPESGNRPEIIHALNSTSIHPMSSSAQSTAQSLAHGWLLCWNGENRCPSRHNPCKEARKIIPGTIAPSLQSSGLPRSPDS